MTTVNPENGSNFDPFAVLAQAVLSSEDHIDLPAPTGQPVSTESLDWIASPAKPVPAPPQPQADIPLKAHRVPLPLDAAAEELIRNVRSRH